jgi:glycosyltransferase involved in cell wall biosynthesis
MTLNIITPTYNRAEEIKKLYHSLILQSDPDFFWTIVDDGSTDNTKEVLQQIQDEERIKVNILYKPNGGKHTALNLAISHTDQDLIFIVDSDDTLTENAVSIIRYYADKYNPFRKQDNLCGFSFLRANSLGTINDSEYSENEKIGTYCNERINAGIAGDKAEVFYTDILKEYPFKVFPNEKYMPEDALWMQMSGPYQMVHINQVIYICDYLEGGLTKSGRAMKIHSPFGMMYRSSIYLNDSNVNMKTKIKMQFLFHIYNGYAKDEIRSRTISENTYLNYRNQCVVSKGFLYDITIIPAQLLYWKWKHDYSTI